MIAPPRSPIHAAARAYAARLGWSVFLVAEDCRTPIKAEGWFEHGVHDATNDVAEIDRRCAAYPAANLALACGPKSGVFALDIDNKGEVSGSLSLMALEDEFGALPPTWRSTTPSKGEHRFFRYPKGRELRNRQRLYIERQDGARDYFPGLDVRAVGGSVALPPSAKPHGPYRWVDHPSTTKLADAPAWLIEIIDPPLPEPKPMPPIRGRTPDRVARYIEVAVDTECAELASMGASTGRNNKLFIASANLGSLVGARLLPQQVAEAALEEAALACGLVKDDGLHAVRATIASGIRKGLQNPREVRFEP